MRQSYVTVYDRDYYYRISSLIRRCIFLPKQSQKSRSILSDGSRSLGLFRKGKTCITAKLHMTNLIICTHSREWKAPSYSRINTVLECMVLLHVEIKLSYI